MHGSKKWIRRYDGKYVRSRDRTGVDWKGKYNNQDWRYRWCSVCKHWERCPECDEIHRMHWRYPYGSHYAHSYSTKGLRKQFYHYFRAEVKQLMRVERYEDIPPFKRAWLD